MAYRFPFSLEGERRQNCSKWNMKKVTKKGYKLLLEKIYLLLKVDSVKQKIRKSWIGSLLSDIKY